MKWYWTVIIWIVALNLVIYIGLILIILKDRFRKCPRCKIRGKMCATGCMNDWKYYCSECGFNKK